MSTGQDQVRTVGPVEIRTGYRGGICRHFPIDFLGRRWRSVHGVVFRLPGDRMGWVRWRDADERRHH